MARAHYLQVTETDFQQAAQNPAHLRRKTGRSGFPLFLATIRKREVTLDTVRTCAANLRIVASHCGWYQLPESNPLRYNTLFFSSRKSFIGNSLVSSSPFRSVKRKEPCSKSSKIGAVSKAFAPQPRTVGSRRIGSKGAPGLSSDHDSVPPWD